MKWRNSLSFLFFPLFVIMFVVLRNRDEGPKPVTVKVTERKVASSIQQRNLPRYRKEVPARSISALKDRKIPHSFYKHRIPASLEETFEKNGSINVSRGYEFVSDVAAVPKENFNPSLGSVIHRDDHFVFFRTNPGHGYIPVAINKSTKILYPISSVLHVRGATQALRNDLIGMGYQQYYYQPALKFLSIQSKSGEVLKLYNDLSKRGLNVQHEVLKPQHQAL